jgi:AcrR family transcriptional regulator
MVVDEDPGQAPGRRGRSKIDSSDPRALRTRSKLVGAFHVAIADSDPSAMSVSSLTQAAGVNRTSFYSHFSSPEDLAIHALSELLDVVGNADIVMRGEHSVPATEASRRALRDIVHFVWERRDSYARVLGPGAAPRLLRAVTEAFTERTMAALEHMDSRPGRTRRSPPASWPAGYSARSAPGWPTRAPSGHPTTSWRRWSSACPAG